MSITSTTKNPEFWEKGELPYAVVQAGQFCLQLMTNLFEA